MRAFAIRLVPAALLAGCTFNTTVSRVQDSPNAPATDSASVVSAPPKGSVALGSVTVRGNRNMAGPACVAEAVMEAKRMGGTHLIVTPVESGTRGVRCTADVYLVGRIVEPSRDR